jgi:hypothetical protein
MAPPVLTDKLQGLTVRTALAAKGEGVVNGEVLATVKIQEPKVVTPVAVDPPLVMENAGTALVNDTVVGPVKVPPVPEKPLRNENWIGAATAGGATAAKTALEAATDKSALATTMGAGPPPPPPPPPHAPSAASMARVKPHLVDVA